MHWWQNAFSSSSSSSSASSSPKSAITYHKKNNVRDLNFFKNRRASRSQPRLTRQRKIRHLSNGDLPLINDISSLSRPNSSSVSQSSSSFDHRSPRSCSSSPAVPQPLPLPDLSAIRRRDLVSSASNSRCSSLPSPKEEPSRVEGDRTAYLLGDWTSEEIPSSSASGSRFAYKITHKSTEHVDTRSAKSATDSVWKMLQDSNTIENVQHNFKANFAANSAPTSGFSSPVRSPRRFSIDPEMNFRMNFPAASAPTSGFSSPAFSPRRSSIAPEKTSLDMLAGLSCQASPDKTMRSPDCSPLYSPKNSGLNFKSPSGASSPLHHKFYHESTTSWHESNGRVTSHPLPLPPGAPVPSQSAFAHQSTAKPEVSSMTSQWQKGRLIGRGTFGSVYVAINRITGASCAMKEVDLIPDDTKSAECIKQLEQEINVLSQLEHPNIVRYYGSEIVGDHFYIYLEYVHPGSIDKYVRDHCGAVTESVVRNFTRHILHGLTYLHSKKTVHRDIKGANLLVDASGTVKLADFGMAKHLTEQAAHLSLKGSPYWMAPEVIQAVMQKDTNSDLALAVDIWSLGCTIIEMLTGKPPWSEFEGAAAMFKVLRESPPIPETLSSEGKDFLQCCFRRNPAQRPSASALLEHRFLRNSHHVEASACTQAFSGMKLVDKAHSPRELTKYKVDSIISSETHTIKGSLSSKSGTGQISHPETYESAAASCHSPRSTLEALPSLSPPHLNQRSAHNSSPSLNVLNNTKQVAGNDHHYAHVSTHGREASLLF